LPHLRRNFSDQIDSTEDEISSASSRSAAMESKGLKGIVEGASSLPKNQVEQSQNFLMRLCLMALAGTYQQRIKENSSNTWSRVDSLPMDAGPASLSAPTRRRPSASNTMHTFHMPPPDTVRSVYDSLHGNESNTSPGHGQHLIAVPPVDLRSVSSDESERLWLETVEIFCDLSKASYSSESGCSEKLQEHAIFCLRVSWRYLLPPDT